MRGRRLGHTEDPYEAYKDIVNGETYIGVKDM